MIWNSFAEFIAMGGRGAFVWGSYGLTALLIAAELFALQRRRREALRRLRQLQELE